MAKLKQPEIEVSQVDAPGKRQPRAFPAGGAPVRGAITRKMCTPHGDHPGQGGQWPHGMRLAALPSE